jgi:hypothetical protein
MIDSIRFYPKDSTPAGGDLRVCVISQTSDGAFQRDFSLPSEHIVLRVGSNFTL